MLLQSCSDFVELGHIALLFECMMLAVARKKYAACTAAVLLRVRPSRMSAESHSQCYKDVGAVLQYIVPKDHKCSEHCTFCTGA